MRRVPNHHVIGGTGAPIQTKRAEQVVERRQCVGPSNRPRHGVPDAYQHAAILVADFQSTEAEEALTPQRTAEREGGLLTVEGGIADVIPIEELGQGLPALVAKEQGSRRMRRVATRAGHDIDDRAGRSAQLRGEPIRPYLKFLDGILRDVHQRPTHDIVVVIHAVDGDVAPAPGLPGGRHDDRLRLGRVEVRRRRAARCEKRELQEVAPIEWQRLDLACGDDGPDD